MTATASREILWNVNSTFDVVLLYGLLAVTLLVGFAGVFRRAELWVGGKPAPEYWGQWLSRLDHFFGSVFLQHKVRKGGKSSAVAHLMVYIGFMTLLFATTMVFIHQDLGIELYVGEFYLLVTVAADIFGLGLLFGLGYFAYRRYVAGSDLIHNNWNDAFVLGMLALMCVQGFILEGLRIHATTDPWAWYSPVGLAVSKFFWPLDLYRTSLLHYAMWWFHTISVYVFLALLPYTKFFHLLSSSINLFFSKRSRPLGALASPGDIAELLEKGEEFSIGLGTIKDYSRKELLDLDACTQCGRCQEVCPAYIAEKPLSPKWVILDTRNHALAIHQKSSTSRLPSFLSKLDSMLMRAVFLPGNGLVELANGSYSATAQRRADNPLVQNSVKLLGTSVDAKISGGVIDPSVFWSCTTCMACVEACPVGINHVDHIIGNRRNMVVMEGQLPAEAQSTIRTLESLSNPYGPPEDRIKWIAGLDVPILKAGDSVDYLYWVGCVSSYDPRKQKIARSLAAIMKAAGLSFGILGTAEGCTGDPARRLGEENLFQTLAKTNIETLKSITFKTLVANCPHCFNTIKNEYPQFGNLGEGRSPEIIHHSVLLKRLLDQGKIPLDDSNKKPLDVTFHDPCYLGRYNGEYDAPRSSLRAIKGLKIVEMDRSREKGLCCGAGGGHFWMDIKVGKRINVIRTDEAAATGCGTVATACPFCLQMMEDGVKLTSRDDDLSVKDMAELIAERLVTNR